jgi:hypothetical protein
MEAALKQYCQKPECIEPHFSSIFCLGYSELSRQLLGEGWILPPYHFISRQFRHLGVENPAATRVGGGESEPGLDSFSQTNKPIGGPGEALQSGNRLSAANAPFSSK